MIAPGPTRAEYATRTIYIDQDLPPSRRKEELAHEAWHCWLFHVPPPADEEQEARLVALVLDALQMDLMEQGGIDVLIDLTPEPPPRELRYVPAIDAA